MSIRKKLYWGFGLILITVFGLFLVNMFAVLHEHSARDTAKKAVEMVQAMSKLEDVRRFCCLTSSNLDMACTISTAFLAVSLAECSCNTANMLTRNNPKTVIRIRPKPQYSFLRMLMLKPLRARLRRVLISAFPVSKSKQISTFVGQGNTLLR